MIFNLCKTNSLELSEFSDSSVHHYCFFDSNSKKNISLNSLNSKDILASLKLKKNILILSEHYQRQNHSFTQRAEVGNTFIALNSAAIYFFKKEAIKWFDFNSFKSWFESKI